MSATPDLIDAQTAPEAPAADAWAERKLAILSELAEAGLEIALALKTPIAETATPDRHDEPNAGNANACADLARAFDRTSRAVRLSIALRDKLLKDADTAKPTRGEPQEHRNQRAERVRRIVKRVVRTHFKADLIRETLDKHVSERLYDTDITGDLANHSIGALVARICADLAIVPRWLDFAEEAWAQAEIKERPPGSPYAAWPDLPPELPDPEDAENWDPEPWDPDDDLEDAGEPDDPGERPRPAGP